jgi:hypothetical protein
VKGEESKVGEWAENGLARKPTKEPSSSGRSSMEEKKEKNGMRQEAGGQEVDRREREGGVARW